MMYYCQGINKVVGIHTVAQDIPLSVYGPGTYVIWEKLGPAPIADQNGHFAYPVITDNIRSDSVKWECTRRIITNVDAEAQVNMAVYADKLQQKRIDGTALTPQETTEMGYYFAIFDWIGRPSGMQAAADSMIASKDNEWWLDVKWPPWNTTWDAFVAKF